jgi:thymidylate synthase (FAD)
MLNLGVAKEVARLVLPVGTYTEWIWSCNAHSLMHFLSLRAAPDAQQEIRMYAEQMLDMWGQIMPVSHEWFLKTEANHA